ncbi:hypothetical protein AGABI2DRAFT_196037 [Agaricus bisporus var. bisporus H97]|uniref:hypothetical protein n=1 Tax=Agaricus bisporus var. bisporus (strain H97 / ATCC MYA-4626 / FGSC 10389) TaxID=936046 RepID=UPI00029F6E13|nr:hypothetical protein AGABI2DRAFT_196037 [Agaricus bisporus var. bisporus H97]EKV41969.1 hypothetical protein AGABI2DRAFT_196037 [Agaricus bisporus var. bisporus H97]
MITHEPHPSPQPRPPALAAAVSADDNDICNTPDTLVNDPPPPYPSPRHQRTHRAGTLPRSSISTTRRIQHSPRLVYHQQHSSYDSQDRNSPVSPGLHSDEDFVVEPTEHTQLLLGPPLARRTVSGGARRRSYSHTSTQSAAPSLARTVISLFQTEEDSPRDPYASDDEYEDRSYLVTPDLRQVVPGGDTQQSRSPSSKGGFFSMTSWRRYFRPLTKKVYYKTLLHLMVINFPYALLAWLYLFVFTVAGTTLLMALPLGAVLCFFNLLGARAFSRGELAIQFYFHKPISYPPPYPPRPIFTRYREREPTPAEIEQGVMRPRTLVRETSFYKNTYAMFSDPTSYQALFYFLVIKPAITFLLLLSLWIFVPLLCILILPAPAVLRAARRLGVWQANVAVEGLYLAVR